MCHRAPDSDSVQRSNPVGQLSQRLKLWRQKNNRCICRFTIIVYRWQSVKRWGSAWSTALRLLLTPAAGVETCCADLLPNAPQALSTRRWLWQQTRHGPRNKNKMSQKRGRQPSPEEALPPPVLQSLDSSNCIVDSLSGDDCRCKYHQFIRDLNCVQELPVPFPMPESKRLLQLEQGRDKQLKKSAALRRIDFLPFSRNKSTESVAVSRLSRFLELLDTFCSAPWLVQYPHLNDAKS